MAAKQFNIVISGAGAAGLSLALLLAKAGLRVAVIDPADEKILADNTLSGRTVALMNSSVNILRGALGDDFYQKDLCTPLACMKIIDVSRGEPLEENFEASDIGEDQYGFNIPNAYLRSALFEAAKAEKGITFFLGDKFHDYVLDGSQCAVRLESGTVLNASLLVGADGRNSAARGFSNIDTKRFEYNQAAMTFVINHSRAHNNTATEFHRPSGPLALVPLAGNQSSVVWVNTHERNEELLRLKRQELESVFQSETRDILGGITLETNPESWPLCSIKAERLSAPRVALVAEAAHVMSPITAQGLNLSLRDVAALAEEVLDAARLGGDIGSAQVLKAYEKRRKLDIDSRVFGVDGMNRIVSNDIEAVKAARHVGLKALSALPPLKRFAMRVGLAPAIDQGRLAKGGSL